MSKLIANGQHIQRKQTFKITQMSKPGKGNKARMLPVLKVDFDKNVVLVVINEKTKHGFYKTEELEVKVYNKSHLTQAGGEAMMLTPNGDFTWMTMPDLLEYDRADVKKMLKRKKYQGDVVQPFDLFDFMPLKALPIIETNGIKVITVDSLGHVGEWGIHEYGYRNEITTDWWLIDDGLSGWRPVSPEYMANNFDMAKAIEARDKFIAGKQSYSGVKSDDDYHEAEQTAEQLLENDTMNPNVKLNDDGQIETDITKDDAAMAELESLGLLPGIDLQKDTSFAAKVVTSKPTTSLNIELPSTGVSASVSSPGFVQPHPMNVTLGESNPTLTEFMKDYIQNQVGAETGQTLLEAMNSRTEITRRVLGLGKEVMSSEANEDLKDALLRDEEMVCAHHIIDQETHQAPFTMETTPMDTLHDLYTAFDTYITRQCFERPDQVQKTLFALFENFNSRAVTIAKKKNIELSRVSFNINGLPIRAPEPEHKPFEIYKPVAESVHTAESIAYANEDSVTVTLSFGVFVVSNDIVSPNILKIVGTGTLHGGGYQVLFDDKNDIVGVYDVTTYQKYCDSLEYDRNRLWHAEAYQKYWGPIDHVTNVQAMMRANDRDYYIIDGNQTGKQVSGAVVSPDAKEHIVRVYDGVEKFEGARALFIGNKLIRVMTTSEFKNWESEQS